MKDLRWSVRVRDRRGKPHRGVAMYAAKAPTSPAEPPAEFQIVLLASAAAVRRVPAATAVCVPRLAKRAAGIDRPDEVVRLADLRRGALPGAVHAQFIEGRVAHPGGELPPTAVFAHRRAAFDLERVSLLLVEQAQAEAMAPYLAVIRRELKLAPGVNATLGLQARLTPADAAERPPPRAPAIMRLHRTVRAVEGGAVPAITLEQLTHDLRFLALFERADHVLRREALDRLLDDVVEAPLPAQPSKRAPTAPVIPLRAPREGQ